MAFSLKAGGWADAWGAWLGRELRACSVALPAVDASMDKKFAQGCVARERKTAQAKFVVPARAVDATAVLVPLDARHFVLLNVDTHAARAVDIPASVDKALRCKWSAALVVGTEVICVPCNAAPIVVIDAVTGAVTEVPLPATVDAAMVWKFRKPCVIGSKVVLAPCHARQIVIYDAGARTVEAIDLPACVDAAMLFKFCAVCAVGATAVLVPFKAHYFVLFNVNTKEVIAVDLPHPIDKTQSGKFRSAVVIGQEVICPPYNADQIAVVDVDARAARALPLPASFDFGRACAIGHKAVFGPNRAHHAVLCEPNSETVETVDLPDNVDVEMKVKYGGLVAVGDTAIFLPANAPAILTGANARKRKRDEAREDFESARAAAKRAWNNREFTDLTVLSRDGGSFPAHRHIVAESSPRPLL
eukprot:gene37188-41424_t